VDYYSKQVLFYREGGKFNRRVIITQQNCYTSVGFPHILHLRLYGALINAHKLLFDAEPRAHSATYTPVNSVTRADGYENQLNCLSAQRER
jgi:hypothetical protein